MTGGMGEAFCEVAAAGAACDEVAAAGCDKAANDNLAGFLPFCLGNNLHKTSRSGGTMSTPVISFASMSLRYNSTLTLEACWSKMQGSSEPLLQGLLMAGQGMPADELPDV